jgi:hypothetical protein
MREIYPIAVQQARSRFCLDLLGLTGCVALIVFATALEMFGVVLCTSSVCLAGAKQTLSDLRWWRWLRGATPQDGFRALQARDP